MSELNDNVVRLAEAVADGRPVEWDDKPSRSQRGLRVIEWISQECRADTLDSTTVPGGDVSESLESPPASWGKLRIVERIARGGFGEVYRAHDPTLQRDVALKLLRPDRESDTANRRFIDEARRLAQVRHPNVVMVHGADEHDDRVGLWTDLLEGSTLEQLLKERGRFSAEEAATVGTALCKAMAAVHGAGLAHGDIKTANAMRASGGQYMLLDFSSARRMQRSYEPGDRVSLSGTPLFMAPELFRGEEAGVRSDIYALGVVLYRLVSGKYPVEARSFAELTEQHERGVSLPLRDARPDLPTGFVQTIERALSADPDQRFATAGEFENALLGLRPPFPQPKPDPEPNPDLDPQPIWKRAAAWVAMAAAVVVLAYAGWEFYKSLTTPALEMTASFYRIRDAGQELLEEGHEIREGDGLLLEMQGTREMYVYVLNEDDLGIKFLLFPLKGLELTNPLAPDVPHSLPGSLDGEVKNWEVSSAGGREFLFVIASVEPLPALEEMLNRIPAATPGGPMGAPLDADVLPQLRGIGRLAPAQPSPEATEDMSLRAVADALAILAEKDRDLQVQRLELKNPR